METSWAIETGREYLLNRLADLAITGDFLEYLRFKWDDYGILGLWEDNLQIFEADVFLGEGLEELASLNFHLLGIKPPVNLNGPKIDKLENDPYRRALAGDNFEVFLNGHIVVNLGSYDPWIDLHIVREGKTLKILSLGWYGRRQELYVEVPVEEWLDSTVRMFAMVVRDFERMRETLLRYGFSKAPREIGRYRLLLRALLDSYPVDVDALPPAYAPWEVEEVMKTTSNLLFRGSIEEAKCVLDSLKNPNHYRQALFGIHAKPEILEKFYRTLNEPYRSEMLAHLAYLYTVEGNPAEGFRIAGELTGDGAFHSLAIGLIRIGRYGEALNVSEKIANPWLRGEILMWLYSESPELEEEIKEKAPEHVKVYIELKKQAP